MSPETWWWVSDELSNDIEHVFDEVPVILSKGSPGVIFISQSGLSSI